MIKKQYEGNSKRALNIVWNAAGRYDFEPPFLAFYSNGKPDHYFNMIIGLTIKWFESSKIEAFFNNYSFLKRAPELDSYMWLAIENCIYEKEKNERLILPRLRQDRAEEFFETVRNYSRQQMEMQSIPVLNQEEARWAYVLGKKPSLMTEKEKRIAKTLLVSGDLDTDGLIKELSHILKEYFNLDIEKLPKDRSRNKKSSFYTLLSKALQKKNKETETLFVRNGTGTGNREGSVTLVHEDLFINNTEYTKNRKYIEDSFGRCIYSDEEMKVLEKDVCNENDEGCHLWITDGMSEALADKEKTLITQSRNFQDQIRKNRVYYEQRSMQIRESIKNLSAEISTIVETYSRSLPQECKRGKLESNKAYRLPLLGDTRVFLNEGDEKDYKITVDILLDASQSRMNYQESLATEAYIIAESFEKAHIPVSIRAFRSICGYTVIENLKQSSDRRCDGAFNYVAAGWNRDGLCLKTIDHLYLDEKDDSVLRFLYVLTDASPNDSMPLKSSKNGLFAKEYEGIAAVEDAREAVKKLRNHGISIGAVFFGASMHLDNVSVIYGDDYVRILKMRQLPEAVSSLFRRTIQKKCI
jgi:hypothetical protein